MGCRPNNLTVVPPVSHLVYSSEFKSSYLPELKDDPLEAHKRILSETENIVKNKHPKITVVTLLEKDVHLLRSLK